ncbi:hypothetical protein FKM82_018009 [Ascaphus truei]
MPMISYCSLAAINSSSPILSVRLLALASMHLKKISACTIILSAPSFLLPLGLVFRSFLVLSVFTMGVSLLVKIALAPFYLHTTLYPHLFHLVHYLFHSPPPSFVV